MNCDVIHFIMAHVISVGSGPVHVVGVWEQQCMFVCVCVCVCVVVYFKKSSYSFILLVEDEEASYSSDEEDLADNTMGNVVCYSLH